jgi:transposase
MVYKRFSRWGDAGVWERMLNAFAVDANMESVMLDSNVVRAHASAAGAQKKRRARRFLRIRLTSGQAHDIKQAPHLLQGLMSDQVIADRGYAAQALVDQIVQSGVIAVIPPHARAKMKREYDRWAYRERHLVECFIGKIKHFRRVFSRFDKLARRYASFVQWLVL